MRQPPLYPKHLRITSSLGWQVNGRRAQQVLREGAVLCVRRVRRSISMPRALIPAPHIDTPWVMPIPAALQRRQRAPYSPDALVTGSCTLSLPSERIKRKSSSMMEPLSRPTPTTSPRGPHRRTHTLSSQAPFRARTCPLCRSSTRSTSISSARQPQRAHPSAHTASLRTPSSITTP